MSSGMQRILQHQPEGWHQRKAIWSKEDWRTKHERRQLRTEHERRQLRLCPGSSEHGPHHKLKLEARKVHHVPNKPPFAKSLSTATRSNGEALVPDPAEL